MLRQKSWMTSATTSGALYASSVVAIPICYVFTNMVKFHVNEDSKGFALLCFGILSMAFICALTRALVGKNESPFLYVFTVGGFASVVNLMIALENDEWIRGFVNGYLEDGEPYLMSSYGTMLSYWGGIGHYTMYLMMVAAIAWRHPFRDVGLYWIGSMLHSMLVLIIGVLSGSDYLHWPFVLHLPFVVMPIICGFYFMHYMPASEHNKRKANMSKETLHECLNGFIAAVKSLTTRSLDLLLILMFIASVAIGIFRGLAALGSGLTLLKAYRDHVEPYMKDPIGFPRIQLLVYMFCFVPSYVTIIYGLLYPNKKWMPDFALFHAGAAIQAQFVHIGSSLNQRTMYVYRLPEDNFAAFFFWSINIILLVVPQLLAFRCVYWPQFFSHEPAIEEVTATGEKCINNTTKNTASKVVASPTPIRIATTLPSNTGSAVETSPADEKPEQSRSNTPMLKVKFGGPNTASGEEIEMSLTQLKAYHDDLRSLSVSATGRNTRRHLSDGGLLPGNIHVRRASGSGCKLTPDDMLQLESLSSSLLADTMKPYTDSGPLSPTNSVQSHEKWMQGMQHHRHRSNVSNQGDGPITDINLESLLEDKLPDFGHLTPASSMSIT